MTTATVVLADDHPALVAACKQLLHPEFDVVAAVHSGDEALAAVAAHAPDVLVLDVEMPGMTGLEVMETLMQEDDPPRVVVLTLHKGRALADRIKALGAVGFVVKSRLARELPTAIRAALAGEHYCSPLESTDADSLA